MWTSPRRLLSRGLPAALFGLFLSGCLGLPDGVQPVTDFAAEDYLGQWYEIARLDHRFERGLSHVTAHYARRSGGKLQVFNRGWNDSKQNWSSATGSATFVGEASSGHLGVSFFGPFRVSYVVFDWDEDAGTAFVSGPDHNTLWLLSRQAEVSEEVRQRFLSKAQAAGFDLSELIWVGHAPVPALSPPSPPTPK